MICVKRCNKAAPVSSSAKHFSSTPIEVYTAVEAPRGAPGNERPQVENNRSKLQYATIQDRLSDVQAKVPHYRRAGVRSMP
jgi:hypothetical protein